MPQTMPGSWDGSYVPLAPSEGLGQKTPVVPVMLPPQTPERLNVLGVRIDNVVHAQAIELLEQAIAGRDRRATRVFFVNAHTLNLAAADPAYRDVLNSADFVFADGTGVRWAVRLQGRRILANMVGTDFVPMLFHQTVDRGYSYFMLGADARTIKVAADYARREFPGWRQAGYHHGYLREDVVSRSGALPADAERTVIDQINAARPDVLLVGMGNPLQEQWIDRNWSRLKVPVCMGIGGLFDFWAGNVSRAPQWLRRLGHEWIWRLYQQPLLKARRYIIGNPLFLARVLRERRRA